MKTLVDRWCARAQVALCGRRFKAAQIVGILSAVAFLVVAAAPVQARQERVESLIMRVFSMSNQPAREALPLVDPLLSKEGSVSLQQDDNALVIRDHASVMEKLEVLLGEFDHPTQYVLLELYLLRASRSQDPRANQPSEAKASGLPEELVTELSNILSLNSYQALGSSRVLVREGQAVRSMLGADYELRFEIGTVLRNRYLKLSDFRVLRSRGDLPEQVFHSNINLKFRRPAFITVSRDAASASGLVVALLWKPPGPLNTGVSPAVPGSP